MNAVRTLAFLKSILLKSSSNGSLSRNAISGASTALVNIFLVFLSYPIYLRFLGAELYGLWATLSIVVALAQMGNLGVNTAIASYLSSILAGRENKEAFSYINASILLILIPCVFITFSSIFFRENIVSLLNLSAAFDRISMNLLLYIGLLSSVVLITDVLKGIIIGLGKMNISNYLYILCRVIQFGVSVVLLFRGNSIYALLVGAFAGYGTLLFLYATYIKKWTLNLNLPFIGFSYNHVKKLLKFGIYMVYSNIISLLMDPLNKIILARYIGLEAVTFYEVGIKGVQSVRSIYESALRAILPKVSELQSLSVGGYSQISKLIVSATKFTFVLALPLFLFLYIYSESILELWLNAEYSLEMSLAFQIFLIGYFINLLSVPSFYALLGLKYSNHCFYAALVRSVIHAILIFGLIKFNIFNFKMVLVATNVGLVIAALYITTITIRLTARNARI